jgi:bifunctional UDP-N-acetylglucosamine pyrophosphorylase/glucosamine-1-phosphate N-acetyltransferase
VLGFRAKDPSGYGRLIVREGELVAIREELDANASERQIDLCNAGMMAFAGARALPVLDAIGCENKKSEFYLTDAVGIVRAQGGKVVIVNAEEDEVRGVNTKRQLAETEAALQQRLRAAALEAGVTLVAPETIFLAADTKFGRDVLIEPFVVFGPGVTVGDNAVIRSFSHIDHATIGRGASVGPYARLRPGARLEENVHIGNFVEVKEAVIEGMRGWARARMWVPGRLRAITTGLPSISPTSAAKRSSAPIRPWWHPSKSETAPMWARAP